MFEISKFFGKWTLIAGEVNSGKTLLTRMILEAMIHQGLASRIAVIDLAPEIPTAILEARGLPSIGGRLLHTVAPELIYLSAPLKPPRLSSANEQQAFEKAISNAARIEVLFRDFKQSARDILFINDISLYLQSQRAEKLVEWVRGTHTIVANGYYGRKLGSGALSQQERREMQSLKKFFHQVIER